ncbi:hypothetical protein HPB49_025973 [Dermacentor silvarum]|nr:hypothetical protein HPB49_025973 [Dermacentor silvarum]
MGEPWRRTSQRATVKGPRVSEGQRETVLSFMEQHPQLASRSSELGPGFTAGDRRRLWQQLADVLNEQGPVVKAADQWQDGGANRSTRPAATPSQLPKCKAAEDPPRGASDSERVAAAPVLQRPVRPPRRQRPRRVDTLTTMSSQCARSLEQGDEMLQSTKLVTLQVA